MTERRKIQVVIVEREDGGIRVYSEDLPGLVLSGKDRTAVLSDIEPAAKGLLEHRGFNSDIEIEMAVARNETDHLEKGDIVTPSPCMWKGHGRQIVSLETRGTITYSREIAGHIKYGVRWNGMRYKAMVNYTRNELHRVSGEVAK